jgi:hypothetical protein
VADEEDAIGVVILRCIDGLLSHKRPRYQNILRMDIHS